MKKEIFWNKILVNGRYKYLYYALCFNSILDRLDVIDNLFFFGVTMWKLISTWIKNWF